jgi:hypothetical protein
MSSVDYLEMKGPGRCSVGEKGGETGHSAISTGLHTLFNLLKTCFHIHLEIHVLYFGNKAITAFLRHAA